MPNNFFQVQEKMPTEAFLMKAYIFLDQGKIAEAEVLHFDKMTNLIF